MRHLLTIALLTATLSSAAQDWGLSWIACPAAGLHGQAWFRRTFTLAESPKAARITIASSGLFELFVNGYNVTTDVMTPGTARPTDTIRLTTYDVARFLHADTNVVAVWHSPLKPSRKQLALSLFAEDHDCGAISITTDADWLCRPANAHTHPAATPACHSLPTQPTSLPTQPTPPPTTPKTPTPSPTYPPLTETIDDNLFIPTWNLPHTSVIGWLNAEPQHGLPPSPIAAMKIPCEARRISHIYTPALPTAAGDTLVCHLGRQCEGWVRLTLRGMHRGDTLRVNGLTYICSGRTDEQACRRFTTEAFSTIVVTGPKGFSRENVMSVEAIEIERHTRRSPLR